MTLARKPEKPGFWKSPYANELAFNNAGDLFVADGVANDIHEFTPSGVESTFASGLDNPVGLAFEPESVPEPSALGLLAVGVTAGAFFLFKTRGDKTTFQDK